MRLINKQEFMNMENFAKELSLNINKYYLDLRKDNELKDLKVGDTVKIREDLYKMRNIFPYVDGHMFKYKNKSAKITKRTRDEGQIWNYNDE